MGDIIAVFKNGYLNEVKGMSARLELQFDEGKTRIYSNIIKEMPSLLATVTPDGSEMLETEFDRGWNACIEYILRTEDNGT